MRAIKTSSVQAAYFQYDGPSIDHPAFPGVANEIAQKLERKHEKFALEARKQAAINALNPPRPSGGYLLPGDKAVKDLAVTSMEASSAAVARRRHQKMKDEV